MGDFSINNGNNNIPKTAIIDFRNGGGFICSVDKEFISSDNTLTYMISLKNTGNVTANKVVFREKFKDHGDIIPGSVYVNGMLQGVADPTFKNGIIVGDILPGKISVIKYKFKIKSVPADNKIKAIGSVNFNYIDNSGKISGGYGESNLNLSTLNVAKLECEDITFSQIFKKRNLDINEEVKYKIRFKNIGNAPANNILIKDTLSKGINFVNDSVTINGKYGIGVIKDNILEIPVGILNPGESYIVEFMVKVNKIPADNVIKNGAEINFSYIEDPKAKQVQKVINCRQIIIPIINANFHNNFKLEANKTSCDKDDEITYTVTMKNIGSVTANKVVIEDGIPEGTILINDSVNINGQTKVISNCKNIPIGDVGKNQVIKVSYKVKLMRNLIVTCIKNQCRLNYNYEVEKENIISNKIVSNELCTKMNTAYIGLDNCSFNKLADKVYVRIGDTICYTLRIKNMGNVDALNIVVKDEVFEGMSFVSKSLRVNGCLRENTTINLGVLIEKIPSQETVIITYGVKVDKLVNSSKLSNCAFLEYDYYVDRGKPIVRKFATSNQCEITINYVDVSEANIKTKVDKAYAVVGDEITYTTSIINTGNLQAKSVVLMGRSPEGSSIVANSVFIDNTIVECGDILNGVLLGTIKPYQEVKISYKVKVNRMPIGAMLDNYIILRYFEQINPSKKPVQGITYKKFQSVKVNAINLSVDKQSSSDYVVVGDIVKYKVIISNKGTVGVKDLSIKDSLSPNLEFIEGSIKVENRYLYENIINGVTLGNIEKGRVKSIEFSARVINYPKEGKIDSKSSVRYKYSLGNDDKLIINTLESNVSTVKLKNIKVLIEKNCDKEEVNAKDLLQFKVLIKNQGDIDVDGFIFREILPNELQIVSNSFSLNGIKIKGVNIKSGIRIGRIKSGKTILIEFTTRATQIDYSYIGYSESQGEYRYKLKLNGESKIGRCNPVVTKLRILNDIKKDITIEGICQLTDCFTTLEYINNIRASVDIVDSYVRKSNVGIFDEVYDKNTKLIINGRLSQIVDFDSKKARGLISNTAEFTKKFSTFISLPVTYKASENINITAKIQDIFYSKIDKGSISTSVLVTFTANIL